MTIEEAKALYDKSEGENSFARDVTRCLFTGVLVKRDEFLLMAEPVYTDGKRVFWQKFPVRNCWFIYFAMGPKGATTPGDFMDEAPSPLPFVAFKRRGKIRIYRWKKIRRDFQLCARSLNASQRKLPSLSTPIMTVGSGMVLKQGVATDKSG